MVNGTATPRNFAWPILCFGFLNALVAWFLPYFFLHSSFSAGPVELQSRALAWVVACTAVAVLINFVRFPMVGVVLALLTLPLGIGLVMAGLPLLG